MGITQIWLALGYNCPFLHFIIEQKQQPFYGSEQQDCRTLPSPNKSCYNAVKVFFPLNGNLKLGNAT